jgi:hypothetical protein
MNMDLYHVIVIQFITFIILFYFIYNYDLVPTNPFNLFLLLSQGLLSFDKMQLLPSGHKVIPSNVWKFFLNVQTFKLQVLVFSFY